MRRSLSTILLAAVATIPAGCAASTTTSPSSPARPTPTRTARPAPATGEAASSGTFTGPVEDMQWGPVQVTIVVKGKRITDVRATAPMERPRSAFINQQAIPWLRQEVLQAQSANIDVIGGATLTSEAFDRSLQGALQEAHR